MASNESPPIPAQADRRSPWSQERRLQFIDFRLSWDGTLNRVALCKAFGISIPQASADIGNYTNKFPRNLRYNASTRTYEATPAFKAGYESSSASSYLRELGALAVGVVEVDATQFGFIPSIQAVPVPTRHAHEDVLRHLVSAIRFEHGLVIDYYSITRDERPKRCITPHAFAFDGSRWHVRAYCELRKGFRDFVLGRIDKVHEQCAAQASSMDDHSWHESVRLVLVPAPNLTPGRKKGVEMDFGMQRGRVVMSCRRALLFYFLRSLGLGPNGQLMRGAIAQVVVDNLEEIREHLPSMGQP